MPFFQKGKFNLLYWVLDLVRLNVPPSLKLIYTKKFKERYALKAPKSLIKMPYTSIGWKSSCHPVWKLIFVGVLGKIGALFVSIPDPIVGGVFMVMFGMIAAVGISNLQFADMNSSRNLFIIGFSIVFGLALPHYMNVHPNAIQTDTI